MSQCPVPPEQSLSPSPNHRSEEISQEQCVDVTEVFVGGDIDDEVTGIHPPVPRVEDGGDESVPPLPMLSVHLDRSQLHGEHGQGEDGVGGTETEEGDVELCEALLGGSVINNAISPQKYKWLLF